MLQINKDNDNNGVSTIAETESTTNEYQSEFTFLQTDQPSKTDTDTADFSFHQNTTNGINLIPDTWILLDSQSTVSVFKNSRYLSNIRASDLTLRVHTNGGTQLSTHIGTVANFGDVWYNKNSLANILSMAAVRKVCRITMDTLVAAAIHVYRQDNSIMTFQEYRSGLYYFDAGVDSTKTTKHNDDAYIFLNTVAGNRRRYTNREIQGADDART